MVDQTPPFVERRATDHAHSALREDIKDIKETLKSLAESMVQLALVEERQVHYQAAQERIFGVLKTLEERTAKLELANVSNSQTNKWVDLGIVGMFVLVANFVLGKVGLK